MTNPSGVIGAEEAEISALERRLFEKLRTREAVARNMNAVHEERMTVGDRIADRVAATMGSWRFIIVQSTLLAIWISVNVTAVIRHWDPYPFILLNLCLSFQAAYAAPIIMMSQNRQAAKDRLQADHDYEVNLKAEGEIEELHTKIDTLRQEQWDELLALQRRQIELLDALAHRPSTASA